jgi:hypothetical protein
MWGKRKVEEGWIMGTKTWQDWLLNFHKDHMHSMQHGHNVKSMLKSCDKNNTSLLKNKLTVFSKPVI